MYCLKTTINNYNHSTTSSSTVIVSIRRCCSLTFNNKSNNNSKASSPGFCSSSITGSTTSTSTRSTATSGVRSHSIYLHNLLEAGPFCDTTSTTNGITTMPRRNKQPNTISSDSKHVRAFSKMYTDETTGMVIIEEGSCSMCIEKEHMNDVFYNPVQVQNRDLSTLMIQLYGERRQRDLTQKFHDRREEIKAKKALTTQPTQTETHTSTVSVIDEAEKPDDIVENVIQVTADIGADPVPEKDAATTGEIPSTDYDSIDDVETPKVQLQVLDALAASGLRSMRYWKECSEYVSHITINDNDVVAGRRALRNIERNGLSDVLIPEDLPNGRPHGIRIITSDAMNVLYNSRTKRQKRPHLLSAAHSNLLGDRMSPELTTIEQESTQNWDVIDIDPYGSAVSFLDAAVQAITHGGLLNVTCTDMRSLSGAHSAEIACSRYGSFPMKSATYFVEYAIRMILYAIATAAGRYGRAIKPILSVGMDFYIRVFVEVYDDKNLVREIGLNSGMVYQSTQCPGFYTLPLAQLGGAKNETHQPTRVPTGVCSQTDTPLKVAGPIWLGPLHDQEVLQTALQRLEEESSRFSNNTQHLKQDDQGPAINMEYIATRERLRGLLTSCVEELPDAPLFYSLNEVSRCVHISTPPIIDVKSALINAGYRVSGFHKEPTALKTDAPSTVIWDIVRAWILRRPLVKPPVPGSTAEKILSVKPSIEVNFSRPLAVYDAKLAHANIKRFPLNPERNWGPKPKASHGKKRKNLEDN